MKSYESESFCSAIFVKAVGVKSSILRRSQPSCRICTRVNLSSFFFCTPSISDNYIFPPCLDCVMVINKGDNYYNHYYHHPFPNLCDSSHCPAVYACPIKWIRVALFTGIIMEIIAQTHQKTLTEWQGHLGSYPWQQKRGSRNHIMS